MPKLALIKHFAKDFALAKDFAKYFLAQNLTKNLIRDFRAKNVPPKSPKDIVPHSVAYDDFGIASTCYASVAAVWLG